LVVDAVVECGMAYQGAYCAAEARETIMSTTAESDNHAKATPDESADETPQVGPGGSCNAISG
jgi:hypothetical protein